jgi:Tfp pilus assembly protein PilO
MLSLQKQIFWLARVQWTLAMVMVLLVTSFVLFGYRPQTRRMAELDAKITNCQREMLLHQGQSNMLSGVQADVERLKARLQEFKRLPQQHELGEVIKDVAQVAQQSSLKKPDIRTGAVVQRGEKLIEAPIQLTFEGDFVNVFSFLKHAEELPRLTRMPSINIKTKDKQGQVKVQMTMDLYCAAE